MNLKLEDIVSKNSLKQIKFDQVTLFVDNDQIQILH
jgi:hypothetical protein